MRSLTVMIQGAERDQLLIESQYHPPAYSSWSGVSVLVGSKQLTSSTWWRFQYLQNSPKDMAYDTIHSP